MGTRAFDENLIKLVQLYIIYIYIYKGTSWRQGPLVFLILQYSPLRLLSYSSELIDLHFKVVS
jgi:hypothetical protein